MKSFDIVALGELLIDFIPDGTDADGDLRFVRKAGGAPLNLLATVAKFGGKAAMIGKVGDDLPGRFLIETVKRCGIDSSCLLRDASHNTTLAFVELDDAGDRSFSFYRAHGADRFLCTDDVQENILQAAKIFHFGSLSLTDEPSRSATIQAVTKAKQAGCMITYDPNYRPPLWKDPATAAEWMSYPVPFADIMKVSVEELQIISGEPELEAGAQAVLRGNPTVLLVTDGPNGAYACMDSGIVPVPAYPADVIDTTGAGDIFFGAFLQSFLRSGKSLRELTLADVTHYTEAAVRIAAKSTEHHGAIAAIQKITEEL